ncbi:MAG: Ig-like domain-containing protein [Thermoplasmata archaeon]
MRGHVFLVSSIMLLIGASITLVPVGGYEPNVLLSEPGVTASWPAIASDEHGIYVVWQDKRLGDLDILFSMSKNNGTTFSEPVVVNDNPGDGTLSSFPDITVGNGRICVVWQDNRNVDFDIYFSQSFDGKNFSNDIAVWQSDTNSSTRPSIAIDEKNDLIYVAWADDYLDIKVSVSSDGGQTFSEPVKVSDSRTNGRSLPKIGVDSKGKVYVVWADGRTGLVRNGLAEDDTDIFISNSTDNGKSFGQNLRVNKEYREILQGNPSLAIDRDDVLHIVWEDELEYGASSILYSSSPDGFKFTDPIFANFTSPVRDGTGTRHQTPDIAVSQSGNLIFVSWAEIRSGNYNVYLARSHGGKFYPAISIFGGDHFFDDILTLNGIRDPGEAVFLDNGNGRLDPGRLNGTDSPDTVVLAGKANLQEDLSGERLLYFDENSDGWDFDDDIVLETPIISYPSIEPKLESEWDNTTGNYVNYLRFVDGFYYNVTRFATMSIGWFDIANAKDAGINPKNFGLENDDPVSKAEIEITYKTDSAYDGTSSIYIWRPPSENISLFPIENTGGVQKTKTIDLMPLGFHTIPDLKSINVSYANNASAICNVSFDKISLWIDRGVPSRFDSYDFRIYNGSSDMAFNDSLSSFADEDNVMFLDGSLDGYYDLGEPLVVTSEDIEPGGQLTSNEVILPRADKPHWSPVFAPFPVNDDTGTSSQYSPSIAIDPGGGCYVVWLDYRGAIESVYFADTVTDSWSPSILEVFPTDGSVNVLLDSEIKIAFSEPIDRSSVESSFSIFPPTAGAWNWSSEGDIAVFQPWYDLLPNATYYLEIPSSVTDISGNPLRERYRWRFTTATPPSIECLVNSTTRAFFDIRVMCNITDMWGVVSASLFYKGILDENYTLLNMSLTSGSDTNGTWMEWIPAQASVGRVSFFVTAVNVIGAEGRYPMYEYGIVRIRDVVPPTLQHDAISSAWAGSRINITAIAYDDIGIERVVLYAKPIGGTAFVPLKMNRIGETDEYYVEMEIPNQNGRIEYYLEAMDVGGNKATVPEVNPQTEPNAIIVSGAMDIALYFWIGTTIVFIILIIVLIFYLIKRR